MENDLSNQGGSDQELQPEMAGNNSYQYLEMPPPQVIQDQNFEAEYDKWNWGAFFLTPFWLIGHKKWNYGIIMILLIFFPIIPAATPALMVYFAMEGNRLATSYRKFDNLEQFRQVERAWKNWGIPLFILGYISVIIILADLDSVFIGQSHSPYNDRAFNLLILSSLISFVTIGSLTALVIKRIRVKRQ